MKAYVIKNKEGKYKTESVGVEMQSYFLRDICCSEIFTDYECACCYCPSDCEVVDITIAEGDLEKKVRKQICDEFKKAIITESIFDTEEEARYWTDDIDVKTILEILDQIEGVK